eukprot:358300-Chlamydomonas_euryale.AAC.1
MSMVCAARHILTYTCPYLHMLIPVCCAGAVAGGGDGHSRHLQAAASTHVHTHTCSYTCAVQVLWQAVEKVIPDIRNRAEFSCVATPLTHARYLRRNRGSYGPAIKVMRFCNHGLASKGGVGGRIGFGGRIGAHVRERWTKKAHMRRRGKKNAQTWGGGGDESGGVERSSFGR